MVIGNHINFTPIHFSSYGNLKLILKQRFDICLFQVSYLHLHLNICIQSFFVVKFYNFAFKMN